MIVGKAFAAFGLLFTLGLAAISLRTAQSFLFALLRREAIEHERRPWLLVAFMTVAGLMCLVLSLPMLDALLH